MYALFFLLIVSCFWKIWKTLSGRKWSIIQTHSLWKSRCVSFQGERVILTISRRKVLGILCLAYIQWGYSAKCGPFQLGACCVYANTCIWINFKMVWEVGVSLQSCKCSLEGMQNLLWFPRRDHGGDLQSQWKSPREGAPAGTFLRRALCLIYLSGFLLFWVATWLSGTILFRVYRAVTGSELLGPRLGTCSGFWEQQVGQLRFTGQFSFGETDWMFFIRRGQHWAFFVRKVRLELFSWEIALETA